MPLGKSAHAMDRDLIFLELEKGLRETLQDGLKSAESSMEHYDLYSDYIDGVFAASEELDLSLFEGRRWPETEDQVFADFRIIRRIAYRYVSRIKLRQAANEVKNSVLLSVNEKVRIRHLVDQIKSVLDSSNLRIEKKEAINKIISELLYEVEKDRTRLDVVAGTTSRLARISADFEREGAEPWWKWFKPIFEILGAAKEREEGSTGLPAPETPKRIEGPKNRLPAPDNVKDDDIPF